MRLILTMLTILTSKFALGQTDKVVPDFSPIYFEQNIDTIDSNLYSRLDNVGQFLADNPDYQLQVFAYGHPTEKNFEDLVFNRATNVLDYLTGKYNIQTHQFILTNSNNKGVVPRPDNHYSEEEKREKRKVEFIIEKKNNKH